MSLIVVKKQHIVKPPLHVELDLSLPLFRGLVGAWTFQEGCGNTLFDRSGFGNHGTINGATWTMSEKGWALDFDGADDYAEVPHDDKLSLGSAGSVITIALAFRRRTTGTYQGLINKMTENFEYDGYSIGLTDADVLVVHLNGDSSNNKWDGTTTIDTEWHTIVVIFTVGGRVACYLDGEVEIWASDTNPLVKERNPLRIGYRRWPNPGNFLDGEIAFTFIWNRALTADEVRELYEMTML